MDTRFFYIHLPLSQFKQNQTMNYNPQIHHRHSIRLKGYDYSQEGLYFVTICTHARQHLFGEIIDVPHVGADYCVF